MKYILINFKKISPGRLISVIVCLLFLISFLLIPVSAQVDTDTTGTTETQSELDQSVNDEGSGEVEIEPGETNGHETEDLGVPEEGETDSENAVQEEGGINASVLIFIVGVVIMIYCIFLFFKKIISNK